MSSQDCFEISKWANEVAERTNKPITYILMKIHEGLNEYQNVDLAKMYVLAEVERW